MYPASLESEGIEAINCGSLWSLVRFEELTSQRTRAYICGTAYGVCRTNRVPDATVPQVCSWLYPLSHACLGLYCVFPLSTSIHDSVIQFTPLIPFSIGVS
jgi:hypothetical protein